MDMAPSLSSTIAPLPEPAPQLPSPSPRQPNLQQPLPLSAAQEAQVKDVYYKRVRDSCGAEIKEFAECAKGRTFTAMWLCRTQRLAMNSCMISHATPEEEDAARVAWFEGRMDRRRKREEELVAVEKRRVEVIDMTRQQEEVERMEKERKGREESKSNSKSKSWWG